MKHKLDSYFARVVYPSENLFFVSPTAFQPQGITTGSSVYFKGDVDKLIDEYEQNLKSKQDLIERLQHENQSYRNALDEIGKMKMNGISCPFR